MEREGKPAERRAGPRSASVRHELTRRIEAGRLPAGSRLPSEPELAAELGVSRATLREALRVLESDGLVRRMWGSGTYVAEGGRVPNSLDLNFGVTEAIVAAGMRPGTTDTRSWVEPASAAEAAALGIEPGQDVLCVERLRTADDRPVVFSRDILPNALVEDRPDAVKAMLSGSIYDVLEASLGLPVNRGVARFRPVRADRMTAERLGVPRGELLLYLWQVDCTEDGAPVLSSHEYHLADAFEFSVVRRGPGRRFT
jgi:GntR family transcriptional regulator